MVKHHKQKQSCIRKMLVFFWGVQTRKVSKRPYWEVGSIFQIASMQHQNNKKRETGRMKGKKKQGNKKENHICQTVAKNRKANASRTFSLVHLIHLHTFHFTCAPQLHLRISTLTHLRTPFKTSCQYWCMSDKNLTRAPQQNFITCAHHWNRVFFNASFPSTSKNH